MKSNVFLIVLIFTIIISCNKKQQIDNQEYINGLWLVKEVKINDQDMTPIADWIQFNADSTQTSGTGWLQHSVGLWKYKKASEILSITYENGSNGFITFDTSYHVKFNKNTMTLHAKSEDKITSITLERGNKLPTLEANKLIGIWKFDSIVINNKEVSDSLNPSKRAMLHLRPENGYTLYNYPLGEKYGIFKAHFGRKQLEMVGYTSLSPKFQFYDFNVEGKNLLLKSKDENMVLKLSRIHQFLE